MLIFERRLTIRVVVDRSLFTLWRRQNRVSYHITITLSIVYLVERRNSVYCYYRISKFQLHTIWSDDEILINALNSLLWNFSNLNLYIFELIFIWYLVSLTNKTSDIFSNRLLEFSLRIVRKSDHERLLSLNKIVFEATQSKRTSTSDISINIRIIARSKYFFFTRMIEKSKNIILKIKANCSNCKVFRSHIYYDFKTFCNDCKIWFTSTRSIINENYFHFIFKEFTQFAIDILFFSKSQSTTSIQSTRRFSRKMLREFDDFMQRLQWLVNLNHELKKNLTSDEYILTF